MFVVWVWQFGMLVRNALQIPSKDVIAEVAAGGILLRVSWHVKHVMGQL